MFCELQINLENAINLNNISGKGGEIYMGELSFLLGDLITTYKPCHISYPYKFLSVYLYFPNNSKDIKDHI